jgi:hypothetical protein
MPTWALAADAWRFSTRLANAATSLLFALALPCMSLEFANRTSSSPSAVQLLSVRKIGEQNLSLR